MKSINQRIEEGFLEYFNNITKEQIKAETYMAGALFGFQLAIDLLRSDEFMKAFWEGTDGPTADWLESKLKEE